ncbi:MAG: hypothetical protein IKN61_09075 [Bacteroidaceae bacterium]|nr:hypothetical protein [Bacteroidaceae bacterium]
MLKTFLTVVLFLLGAMLLLSVSILLNKNGKFPNIHVGRNPAMRKRNIGCVEEQDKEAQKINPLAVNEK